MYKVRNETVPDKTLLDFLRITAENYEAKLHRNGIYPNNIYIWVKEYNGQLFPKIEFDIGSEELQYDLLRTQNGFEVGEIHFKTFVKQPNGYVKRLDVKRQDAHVTLQAIDVILRS